MITIHYIDETGIEQTYKCRDEHHAMMLELTLAAEGLEYWREEHTP